VIEHAHRSPGESPPPEGPPWDSPIAEAALCFIDLEMTGLRVGEDRVVELCLERGTERFESIVNPGERRGAEHVHGISDEQLRAAPTFADVADRVTSMMSGAVVIAHGVPWDLAFLRDELSRLGRSDVPEHALDTVVLARRAFHLRSYGLAAVAAALEIEVSRAHRAGDDVTTTRKVFERLVVELAPTTPRDLWEVRVGERAPRPEVVAAAEQAVAAAHPVTVMYRPSHRAAAPLRMVLTALVPPHAIGYLLPGRGRRQLRLDRILRIDPDLNEG
jgi:DNA polymerase III subunit epsilon